jgi:hypothetical protein
MGEYRGTTSNKCSYHCALNRALGKDYLAHLKSLAQEIEGCTLSEVVINRYDPGDYIPDHYDRSIYAFNQVIHLEDSDEEGIIIDGEWHPQRAGQSVVFKGAGKLHSVPPVKNTRYTLIYLFSRGSTCINF